MFDGSAASSVPASVRYSPAVRPAFQTNALLLTTAPATVTKPGRDGTVTKAGISRGWFNRGGLESQVMQPGDALIVPTEIDFETWGRALVRNLKDFAQIFSGFGIGIAAINSLN